MAVDLTLAIFAGLLLQLFVLSTPLSSWANDPETCTEAMSDASNLTIPPGAQLNCLQAQRKLKLGQCEQPNEVPLDAVQVSLRKSMASLDLELNPHSTHPRSAYRKYLENERERTETEIKYLSFIYEFTNQKNKGHPERTRTCFDRDTLSMFITGGVINERYKFDIPLVDLFYLIQDTRLAREEVRKSKGSNLENLSLRALLVKVRIDHGHDESLYQAEVDATGHVYVQF